MVFLTVGGNSAGLLNFGRQPCPYDLVSPWEFGTRQQNGQRQTDTQLKLVCLDQPDQSTGLMQNAPAPIKAGINLVRQSKYIYDFKSSSRRTRKHIVKKELSNRNLIY
jgi:hypothetical protein